MRRACLIIALGFLGFAPRDARAHFLFIHIGPPAEAGRTAEVYFSEQAQAGDPTFTEKIAHTQLWVQKNPGEFHKIQVHKGPDRLRAALPMSGSVAVIGECQYGVLARPNQVPFLLRYYPKAISGKPDELNAMRARKECPLEVMATIENDTITFVALRNGQPLPGALFTTVDAELSNVELSADADGRASWKPPARGRYSVYTRFNSKEQGEVGGRKYEEIREFATLAFTWPLAGRGPDPEAVAMFQEAVASRAEWRAFPGFKSSVSGHIDGREFSGTATIDASGSVMLNTDDEATASWVQEQLESIAMHRGAGSARSSSAGEGRPVVRFADEAPGHPLGRLLIFEGGSMASSYRVKNRQITVVNRNMGSQNMTITVLDNDQNPDGRFLPRSYTVQYWDAETGDLNRTETVQDRWNRVGSWDLPASHTVTVASKSGLSVRAFVLTNHELLASGD